MHLALFDDSDINGQLCHQGNWCTVCNTCPNGVYSASDVTRRSAQMQRRRSSFVSVAACCYRRPVAGHTQFDDMPTGTAVATGEWRNGRRAGFRCQCPSGRGGSSPPSPTRVELLLCNLCNLARIVRGSACFESLSAKCLAKTAACIEHWPVRRNELRSVLLL